MRDVLLFREQFGELRKDLAGLTGDVAGLVDDMRALEQRMARLEGFIEGATFATGRQQRLPEA